VRGEGISSREERGFHRFRREEKYGGRGEEMEGDFVTRKKCFRGFLAKLHSKAGAHVAAAGRFCMNLHMHDKVLYRGNSPKKVLYESVHGEQGFVQTVQLSRKNLE
jgi:hypothetical protein